MPTIAFAARSARQRVLVIAAHPDDEVLGCGGTMARHAAAGDEVHVLILGEGITSRGNGRNHSAFRPALAALKRDIHTAARILGVSHVTTHTFPDNRFDGVERLQLIKAVEREKTVTQPTVVYTHHPNDLNIDHRCVADAVQTAFRPQPGDLTPTILAFEVHSSTEYQSALTAAPFRPNLYVDVTTTLSLKREAMAAYRSEVRPYPHPRSPEALDVIARRSGLEVGLEAAERFAIVRAIVGPPSNRTAPSRDPKTVRQE